ncbi:hypothetical protein [Streptomyces rubiginosohelvolus]|uniref:hypothetical protein n=1 Tax=Streptomyces rubiginosohelvolus TaxID=67362 RepID=UPI0033A95620
MEAGYRLYTTRWALSDLTARRRSPAVPDPDRRSPADPGEPPAPEPADLEHDDQEQKPGRRERWT